MGLLSRTPTRAHQPLPRALTYPSRRKRHAFVCAGYNLAESVYEDIMEMLDREADGSDSLEVSTNRLSAYTADNACRDVLRLPLRLPISCF
jgi:hypothetical protein